MCLVWISQQSVFAYLHTINCSLKGHGVFTVRYEIYLMNV